MKIDRKCKNCNKSFQVESREAKRTDKVAGIFCSRSCCVSYTAKERVEVLNICKHCGREYSTVALHSKYCSNSCKQKNYRSKGKSDNMYDRKLLDLLGEYPCEICNWSSAPRDVHHIIPVSENGKNIVDNLITLCPNHHRMVHTNSFSQDYLFEIVKSRTISSSLKLLLDKIKEQDANSGY